MGGVTSSENRLDFTTSSSTNSSENQSSGSVPASLPQEFTDKYDLLSKIGHGGFGSVYKIKEKKTGQVYAAKHFENNESNNREISLQASICEECIVKIHDVLRSEADILMVMEYCEGGNLLEWIKRNRRHQILNEKVVLQMLTEICAAVHACHHHKVVHRDLKPENILLDSRRRIKIGDFGVARKLNRSSIAKTFCGTPPYMAPELFLSYLSNPGGVVAGVTPLGYDNKVDVWSIGCILYDMANTQGRFVYHLHHALGFDAARSPTDSTNEKDITELIDTDIPQEYKVTRNLLHMMLIKAPQQRASLSDVLHNQELKEFLENPMHGHWSDLLDEV